MLKEEAELHAQSSSNQYVAILVDEIKVKESLVFDNQSAQVIGFVELNVDQQLQSEEKLTSAGRPIATHLLVLMVWGLFSSLKFPYAHFPTKSLTGDELFSIVWEGIECLERCGFKVMAITADGASSNRKFFRIHSSANLTYKTPNPYTSEDRNIYFFSDVPHLIKTTRNCWLQSSVKGTRNLWVSHEYLAIMAT